MNMQKFKFILYAPILLLFIQSSCKKDNDNPKTTTYGAYQFAAKVNGVNFIPDGDLLNPPIYSQLEAIRPGKYAYYIVAHKTDNSSIEIYIDNFTGVGTYPLNTFTYGYPVEFAPPNCGMYYKPLGFNTYLWITNAVESGSVTFTEYSNGKTKCSFSFKAKSLTDGTVVEVTEGYFSETI
jgi:hypothetical protein